ncbi:hypothetical protein N7475_001478 [Penicillium sp. IBT 31633x]|nr:hypothetical protein N7475_001478 [Penicillium sp. IBT 31633x]
MLAFPPVTCFLVPFCLSFSIRNMFPIPEIIFDPTLVLSPHVFVLGMLFRIGAFKSLSKDGPVIDCPEKLYRLRILDGLGGEITSFAKVAKPYYLRYGVAKAFNDSQRDTIARQH